MNTLSNTEPCPDCGRFANRGVSIDAVILRDNKILLIKRGVEPFKGYWATPGGFVVWDESIEDAVRREVKEETSLSVTNLRFVKLNSDPKRHPRQVINVVYAATVESGDVKHSDDADDAQWFELDDLPAELAFDHAQNIKEALQS